MSNFRNRRSLAMLVMALGLVPASCVHSRQASSPADTSRSNAGPTPAATEITRTAPAGGGLTIKRVILLYRHGVRAPLSTEAPVEAYAPPPFPAWETPASVLTLRGYQAVRLIGGYDRQRLVAAGLLPGGRCPDPGTVVIWSNSTQRTIASGKALAEGLAPGCELAVGHRALGERDPLFHPSVEENGGFDAETAVAAIIAESGGPARLIAPYARQVRQMQAVLGCDRQRPPCDILAEPGAVEPSQDGRGITLTGPIATLSGTAQVLMLEYVEGLPLQHVGWGRATPQVLEDVSRLHALLFDIHARPRYMARWIGGAMARRILSTLSDPQAARLTVLVGHDNNIAALTGLLSVHFKMEGYALDDPPIGGALGLELLENAAGETFVRVFYQSQTPEQLRALTPLDGDHPPSRQTLAPACSTTSDGLCRLDDFMAALQARLAVS